MFRFYLYILGGNLFQAAAQQAAARQQGGGDVDLSALRQSSQFQLIRQAIQENPSLLQPILSSLGAANPHLFQVKLNLVLLTVSANQC